jgi:hypothetical protein
MQPHCSVEGPLSSVTISVLEQQENELQTQVSAAGKRKLWRVCSSYTSVGAP